MRRESFGLLAILTGPAMTSCVATHGSGVDTGSVTVCQVLAEPKRYDHKLLKISGTMSHGFEGFSISDSKCPQQFIWLEYGGSIGSGTIFAGDPSSQRARDRSLVIEGMSTSMVYDYEFRKFDNFIQTKHSVNAFVTVAGRYFSGEPIADTLCYGGYGHLNLSTLFIIQRVIAFRSVQDAP